MNAWLLLGIALLVWAGWQAWRGGASRSWPTAPGRILSVEVMRRSGRRGPKRRVHVAYEYTAAGGTYRGSRIRYGHLSRVSRQRGEELRQSFPPDSSVAVHHHPSNPAVSVLKSGVDPLNLLVAVGCGVAALAYGIMRSL
ncbi:MAG: hypothetical protein QOG89_3530 [Thermomicrobiales bacterium]|jgi:hypothetical protein|nr:hypothetical protein [Thermomicrobiales bacterium]MEA2531886.1 hypothetical protein [Thermomicrobiales bacterium]